MTDEDAEIEAALKKCADAHLPDDFADRLVKRILESKDSEEQKTPFKTVFTRIALIAASLTLLLGFVPGALDRASGSRAEIVARCDGIRAVNTPTPQDGQLNALAFLGFCREVIRRRVRSSFVRGRRREEEE